MPNIEHYINRMYTLMGGLQNADRLGKPHSGTWQPLVNVYERAEDIVVMVELPGVDKDKIRVDIEGDILRIEGVRPAKIPEGTHHMQQMEIPVGRFARLLRLPHNAERENVVAEYDQGYLTVTIPCGGDV